MITYYFLTKTKSEIPTIFVEKYTQGDDKTCFFIRTITKRWEWFSHSHHPFLLATLPISAVGTELRPGILLASKPLTLCDFIRSGNTWLVETANIYRYETKGFEDFINKLLEATEL